MAAVQSVMPLYTAQIILKAGVLNVNVEELPLLVIAGTRFDIRYVNPWLYTGIIFFSVEGMAA